MALAPAIHVTEWGSGERAVLVHGGDPFGGATTFSEQEVLGERWHLIVPDRPGHGNSPRQGREDFEHHGELLAPLLDDGPVHLVGHSYGGMVALYMATARPDAIGSLTLIEPPAFGLAPDDPAVQEMSRAGDQLFANPPDDPLVTVKTFFGMVGIDMPLPDDLPNPRPEFIVNMARDLADIRSPHEAHISVDALNSGGYPILVLTSGRTAGFEGIAAALVERVGAEHIVVPDTDHLVQRGAPVNDILERFWNAARARA
jgi:pimeloyl-ACP methyl ester carboxylesterase